MVAALNHKKTALLIISAALIGSICLAPFIGAELFPSQDAGQVECFYPTAMHTVLEETEKVALEVEDIVNKIPEVDLVMNSVGGNGMMSTGGSTSNTASLVIVLKPLEERDRSDQDIAHELQDAVNGIPGAEITVSAANMMSMGR